MGVYPDNPFTTPLKWRHLYSLLDRSKLTFASEDVMNTISGTKYPLFFRFAHKVVERYTVFSRKKKEASPLLL